MNLQGILARVERALQAAPNVQSRVDDWRDVINDHYLAVMEDAAFGVHQERVAEFTARATVTLTAATAALGSYQLTAVAPAPASDWEGHVIYSTDADVEFRITRVSGTTIWLSATYPIPFVADTFEVRFYSYRLPRTCGSVLGVSTRTDDVGEIRGAGRLDDERSYYDPDTVGPPEVWIPEDEEQDRAPRSIAAAAAAGGGLQQNTEYRYLYAFLERGRLSSPSLIVSATTTLGDRTINLSAIEATTAGSGVLKRLYRETARDGLFKFLVTLNEGDTTYADTGAASPSETAIWDDAGPYRYIRFWPRPSSNYTIRLRHQLRPTRLRHMSDVPLLPEPYHSIIAHRAAAELLWRAEAYKAAEAQERRAQAAETRLVRRTHKDEGRQLVVGSWTDNLRPGVPIIGTATLT